MTLTSKQRQYLKGLAHELNPLVQVGKEGLTSNVLSTIQTELANHELLKVKIGNNSGLDKDPTAELIAQQTESQLVQVIGKILILFKNNPEKPKDKRILLPRK